MSLADPVVNIIGWCYHVVDLHYSCYNEFYSVDKLTCENITGRHCIPHIICQIPPALSFLWTENTQHCAADTKLTRYKKTCQFASILQCCTVTPQKCIWTFKSNLKCMNVIAIDDILYLTKLHLPTNYAKDFIQKPFLWLLLTSWPQDFHTFKFKYYISYI